MSKILTETTNLGGYNKSLDYNGSDDVIICWECLFDELLYDCELRGRSHYYAQQNITKYEVCWMCKKEKRLLYKNIPISKDYREEHVITRPEEEIEKNNNYSCMKCFENSNLILYDELEDVECEINDCSYCSRSNMVCVLVREIK